MQKDERATATMGRRGFCGRMRLEKAKTTDGWHAAILSQTG
jgi:hypothetical protein